MCGRFSITVSPDELKEAFPGVEVPTQEELVRYNIAPSQPIPVIANNNPHKIEFFRWGLIPSWAKDEKIGYRMINARAESLAEKPAFRNNYKRHRCLVIASGFFEWQQEPGSTLRAKTPMYIRLKSGLPFGFAGLWDVWRSPEDEEILSCTIVTTDANSLLAKIHDRMPVIIDPKAYATWLDPEPQSPETLNKLLKQYPASQMVAYPVSKMVNDPKNDVPEVIEPMAA